MHRAIPIGMRFRERSLVKKIAVVMMVIAIIVISMAIFQPMVSGFVFDRHPNVNNFATHYLWPSSSNLFGTDKYGDSLFDVVWSGARTSVSIGFLATLITTVVGVLVGAVWGYSKRLIGSCLKSTM